MVRSRTVIVLSLAGTFFVGCTTRLPLDVEELPPTEAGSPTEHVVDNTDVAFYTTGDWATSQSAGGYEGSNYSFSSAGTGSSVATWNLNLVKSFEVFAKWTSHPNRGSNVKFVVHHLDTNDNLVTEVVSVNQKENGGQWVKLGTYRMSALTGRVTVSDNADGYVIADAVLFREIGTPETTETADGDGDGISDEWERSYGLNPNDPTDASQDQDGDGLSNQDEFILQTDPTVSDSDGDGIPDGYEATYGLDPVTANANADSDGDGVSDYDEYLANTDPRDKTSSPSGASVLLTWDAPTQRTDGSPLPEGEIAEYELVYSRVVQSQEITVDNESPDFLAYGSGGFTSNSTNGYQGSNYFVMPAGSGENSGEWSINTLTSDRDYDLSATWTSHPNRGSNVQYEYLYIDRNGDQASQTTTVNQRNNGGTWQKIGNFQAGDSAITVRITNNADGYVIADAIKVTAVPPAEERVIIEATGERRYIVTDLPDGQWVFKIRAIDSNGLAGSYSEVKSQVIN